MNVIISALIGVALAELGFYKKPTNTFQICTFAIAVIAAVKNFGIFQ